MKPKSSITLYSNASRDYKWMILATWYENLNSIRVLCDKPPLKFQKIKYSGITLEILKDQEKGLNQKIKYEFLVKSFIKKKPKEERLVKTF